ncbi:MAG: hypothetical protein WBM61_12065, partial [Woeseiaceae bacterium]
VHRFAGSALRNAKLRLEGPNSVISRITLLRAATRSNRRNNGRQHQSQRKGCEYQYQVLG